MIRGFSTVCACKDFPAAQIAKFCRKNGVTKNKIIDISYVSLTSGNICALLVYEDGERDGDD